ncbi:carboxyltransferase domain-containing protein [Methylobacterium oryzae]
MPCCYDAPHGEDVAQVAERSGLSPENVVSTHAAAEPRTGATSSRPATAR